jgi:hypothetical protein
MDAVNGSKCCAQQTGMHIRYGKHCLLLSTYLETTSIYTFGLPHCVRQPRSAGTCPAEPVRAGESQPKRGLLTTIYSWCSPCFCWCRPVSPHCRRSARRVDDAQLGRHRNTVNFPTASTIVVGWDTVSSTERWTYVTSSLYR